MLQAQARREWGWFIGEAEDRKLRDMQERPLQVQMALPTVMDSEGIEGRGH